MPLTAGTTLGPYEIQAPLGAGGMGEVYKARDTRLDRTVAIKVLPEHVAADPELKQRFEREARAVAALNHPHICTLYDIGSQDGIDFLVMEPSRNPWRWLVDSLYCNRACHALSSDASRNVRLTRTREEQTMRSRITRLVGVWISPLILVASLAVAAGPDVRLVNAAAERDADAVRALLDAGIDVDAARADGVTALLWAAHWDDLAVADLLVRAGADVTAADDHGVTPLERAAENASLAMVEKLLAAGGDPNATQTSGLTPLMTAARTGDAQVVGALLRAGADVTAATIETQSTALMWAVSEGHADVVQLLLAHGAPPRTSTAKGFTPLMYAARNGDIPLAEVLLTAGVDVNDLSADGTHVLPYAIVSGQDQFALFLLEQGADPNGAMGGGVHALHAAAGNVGTWLGDWYRRHGRGSYFRGSRRRGGLNPARRLPLVQALLEHGADPNARITSWAMFTSYIGYPTKGAFEPFANGTGDLRGATPLWVAATAAGGRGAFRGDRAAAEGEGGAPPEFRYVQMMQALLAAGADPHATTVDGTTPLMVASGLGRIGGSAGGISALPRGARLLEAEQAVRVLLEAGADINATNEADFRAIHGAAFLGANELIELLVHEGADINVRDFRGRTPYRLAEGAKQSFHFVAFPESAAFIKGLGANVALGIPGTVQERLRDAAPALTDNQN